MPIKIDALNFTNLLHRQPECIW